MAFSSGFSLLAPLVVAVVMAAMAEATPPGIAKNPSHATCKIKKYKHCYNLVHVCPKFCPDQCTVECASCKPICGGDANPPPEDDPTPATPSPPSPPSETYSPPTPSPPPSTPTNPNSPSNSYSPPTPATPSSPPSPSAGTTPSPPTISSPPPVTATPPPSPVETPPKPTPPVTSPPPYSHSPSTPPANPNPPPTPSTPNSPLPSLSPPSSPPKYPPTAPSPPAPSAGNPSPPTVSPSTPPATTPSTPNSPSLSPPPTPSETPSSPTTNTPPPPSPTPSPPRSPPASPPRPPPTGVAGQPPAPLSPPSSSAGAAKRVRCKNANYSQCYNMIHTCPSACPGGCEVDCVTCKPVCHCDRPGAVCQDPRFIGGDGITFYFHGKKDRNFCLVSDPNLHINAHLIGKRNQNLKRDFTWVQSLGILFGSHQLFIGAQETAAWDDSVDSFAVALNGQPVTLPEAEGSQWQYPIGNPSIFIVRLAPTNHVIVEAKGLFRITVKVVPITEEDSRIHNYGITKENSFAHLDVGFKFFSLSSGVSGVLGQTYSPEYTSRINVKATMPVMGREEEFETSSLFEADCAVARFGGGGSEEEA